MAVLLLLTLALPLNAVSAVTESQTGIYDQNSSQICCDNDQNLADVTAQNSKTQETTNQHVTTKSVIQGENAFTQLDKANSSTEYRAAGSESAETTVTTTQVSFSSSQINSASSNVKSFIESNNRLPDYVTVSGVQVSMPQFLQLLTDNLLNLGSGLKTSVVLDAVNTPTNPSESVKSGNIYKSEYLTLAQTIKSSIDSTGIAPDYVNSSLGKIRYETLIYTFSKILNFQNTNGRLPNYVSVTSWTGSSQTSSNQSTSTPSEGTSTNNSATKTSPTSLQQYLKSTTNAPSTNSAITSLTASITSGLTSDYDKATAIFNWVRDHITYSYYYNTKKGALGTLSSRTANCCDTSHLVVALARAAGIPARYQLGNCVFSSGTYGHVWAQLYVNGKWYYADAISKSNSFGVIKNWNLNTYTLRGTYATLPF
ncbi:MAG: Transglutaminase-like superfamily protein [Methanobacterium sp. PtaU1.Bin242]|nr:MAG: Transglutaminase-like superfamily protein [Methanobacterium sp. PtaU1.Bin242]